MSAISVIGFTPPDEEWQKMKKVWDSCTEAGLPIPNEVQEFFNYEDPDPAGIVTDIPQTPYRAEMIDGYEVEVAKIPKNVKTLRFIMNWD